MEDHSEMTRPLEAWLLILLYSDSLTDVIANNHDELLLSTILNKGDISFLLINTIGLSRGYTGHELLRAGAHGLASATLSVLEGGDFGSSFLSGAASSVVGSYAPALSLNTKLMVVSSAVTGGVVAWATGGDFLQGALNGFQIGLLNHAMHDDGFGITYHHDKDGNQCGDISEIVVTPTDKTDLFAVAETANTIVGSVGSSMKNNGGNSTWGSNYKIYWHAQGEQGFYGNQYVKATKLIVIGNRLTRYTGPVGKTLNFIQIGQGAYSDYEDYSLYGYTDGYNTIMATAKIIGGGIGAIKLMEIGAYVGSIFGPAGTFVGGAVGGMIGNWGGDELGKIGVNILYGR